LDNNNRVNPMRIILLSLVAAIMTGCVSNKSIQTVQVGDEAKSCSQIQAELAQLGAIFEEVKDESGVTGKNIGLAIVFWPGIIVNEVRSNKNEDSVDDRITHLTGLYSRKCSGDEVENSKSLKDRLIELKGLFDQGLLTEDEYEIARKKAVEES